MFSRPIVVILCIALATLSSRAFGVIIEVTLHAKDFAKENKDFRVEAAMREGSIHFKVTRFAREGRHYSGKLVIRKGGETVVSCDVQTSEDKSRVSYVFNVAPEYTSESEFVLSEDRWIDSTIEFADGKKETMKNFVGDMSFHIVLAGFAKSANDAH
jgi:hypothetical protein